MKTKMISQNNHRKKTYFLDKAFITKEEISQLKNQKRLRETQTQFQTLKKCQKKEIQNGLTNNRNQKNL